MIVECDYQFSALTAFKLSVTRQIIVPGAMIDVRFLAALVAKCQSGGHIGRYRRSFTAWSERVLKDRDHPIGRCCIKRQVFRATICNMHCLGLHKA